ncbi:MAG: radical SAM protein [Thermoplasmatales archaeon]|nr:MAG: radical SAM protein [Thermoplasmatales archaeon]
MKFLLIRPGDREKIYRFFICSPLSHPPLGLLYLGAALENNGHEVEVLDYYAEDVSREQLEKSLKSSDAVGMMVYTNDFKPSLNISRQIKEIDPKIPLIIGGPHCTFLQKQSLIDSPNANICVVGEGEEVILDIAKNIQGKKNLSDINGIYYRENKLIKSGKPLKVIENIDDIPFPARHLVDKYEYGAFAFGYNIKKKVTSLITSKGCPYQCRFCSRYSNLIKEWSFRKRSAENVVNEILEINDKYRSIMVVDDNFLADKKRAHKIFDMLLEADVDIDFLIEGARVDTAEKELYIKMKKAGVKFILYGLESGNQDVLDFYNKNINLPQIRKAINLARQMNFFITASFIIGAPIESKKHVKNTINFACSLPIDLANFAPLVYLRGSDLWTEAVENNIISQNEDAVLADISSSLGNFTKEELIDYTIEAFNSFYFRPKYLIEQIYKAFLRRDYSLLINGLKYFNLFNRISDDGKKIIRGEKKIS